MKKIILLFVALLVTTASLLAQGINFEHGDWASVKAKAKQENKIIFIDFYTSWCGPCKMLSKNIFPLKEVGDFYNKHFVSYKVDAEKGEGPKLAQKYGVKAYPTLVFTDANGKFLHQGVGGMQAKPLIELGKAAMDPAKQLSNLLNDKNEEAKDVPAYLRKLSGERLPFNDKYEAYINSLSKKDLLTPATYDLMVELGGRNVGGFTFDLIYKNKEAFKKAVGEKKVENYFFRKYLSKAYTASNKKESVEPVYKELEDKGFDYREKIGATIEITGYCYEGKHEEFLNKAPAFLEKYGKGSNSDKYRSVFMTAVKYYHYSPKMKAYAHKLGDELIAADYKVASVYSYLGKSIGDEGDFKTALEYYKKASAYNQEKGLQDNAAQSVEFITKRIAILEKGDYTFHISGLEEYNGLKFKLFYLSTTQIGERLETEGVEIKNGACTIKGNVKALVPAIWGIYEGDKMKTKGDIILEPGEYRAKVNGRDLDVKQGWYNYYALEGLRAHPRYAKALKNLKEWSAQGLDKKDPAVRKEYMVLLTEVNNSRKEYYESTYAYNADPSVKLLAFYVGDLHWEDNAAEKIKELKAKCGDHYLLKTIEKIMADSKANLAMKESLAIGKQIKPFVAKNLSGKEVKLEKVLKKNKYVLVEFWASWCGPCRGFIPHLKEAYEKYNKKGFEIVSFSLDDKARMWKKASDEENIPWVNVSDLLAYKSPIIKMYGITGIPDSFLVDKNGKIIGTNYRGDSLDEELERLLK
jgi:thiol-disulfide isomerase/thioredoxin